MKTFRNIAPVIVALVVIAFFWVSLKSIATAQESSTEKEKVQYLFVQTAHGVTFHGDKMTMHGVAPTTLFFSDRPERIVGHGATEEYVSDWSKGDDSFASDPPNATLSILGDKGEEIKDLVVTLEDPRLMDGNLTYTVKVLDGSPPAIGGASALFIDIIGRPLTPLSFAGARRRAIRRDIYY
jgi:hypothetical protein